jgi:hypothetical protein
MTTIGPPLWSIDQSSWLHIQRPQVRLPIREVVGLEKGPFRLVRITDVLFQVNSSFRSRKLRITAVGIRTTWHPLSAKVDTNFVDQRQSLGRYRFLADCRPWSFFYTWTWTGFCRGEENGGFIYFDFIEQFSTILLKKILISCANINVVILTWVFWWLI